MSIGLPDLPYAHEALEPLISGDTLRTHHGKHHRGYVDRLNALVQGTRLAGDSLETIVKSSAGHAPADPATAAIFNNAAQAWNHAFYWKSLRPKNARGPRGALAARIQSDFGDERRFAEAFKSAATGHFGSGWAWLVLDGEALKIVTTSNADTPLVHGQAPLLVINVWEHAYYLDYRERRAIHVAGVVDHLLDWEFAECNYELASGERIDDAVYVSGRCLGVAGLESALAAHPKVAEAAIVSYPHPTRGRGIYAYVALNPDVRYGDRLRRELGQWMRKTVGPMAVPDRIQPVPSLPRNRLGVLARDILRKIAANNVSNLGDTSTLVDASVVTDLIRGRADKASTAV